MWYDIDVVPRNVGRMRYLLKTFTNLNYDYKGQSVKLSLVQLGETKIPKCCFSQNPGIGHETDFAFGVDSFIVVSVIDNHAPFGDADDICNIQLLLIFTAGTKRKNCKGEGEQNGRSYSIRN